MCVQRYFPCANYKCNGVAQILELISCEDDPNCEITFDRIRGRKRSTEGFCPNCRTMTKGERKQLMARGRSEKAKRAKLQEGKINDPDHSARVEVEQQADPSAIGERIGASSGGILPGADNIFSNFKFPSLLPEEERFLRSNIDMFLRNPHRAELVRGYGEPMVEAPTNRSPLVNSYPYVTQRGQEANPGAAAPAPKNVPQSVDSFLPRASNEALQYGSLANTRPYYVRTQVNIPSTPPRKHQQPAPTSPTSLSEELNSFNAVVEAGHIVNCPSPPPFSFFLPAPPSPTTLSEELNSFNAAVEAGHIVNCPSPPPFFFLSPAPSSPTTLSEELNSFNAAVEAGHIVNCASPPPFSSFSPRLSNQPAINLLTPGTWSLPPPRLPLHASSSPQIPIGLAVFHTDHMNHNNNARNPTGNMQESEQQPTWNLPSSHFPHASSSP